MLGANTKTFKSYGKNKTNVRSKIITSNWASSESDSSPKIIKTTTSKSKLLLSSRLSNDSTTSDNTDSTTTTDTLSESEEEISIKIKPKLTTTRDFALNKLKVKRQIRNVKSLSKLTIKKDDQENDITKIAQFKNSPIKKVYAKQKPRTSVIIQDLKGKGKEVVVEIIIPEKRTPLKARLLKSSTSSLVELDSNSPVVRKPLLSNKSIVVPKRRITLATKSSKSNLNKMVVHSDELDKVIEAFIPKPVSKLVPKKKIIPAPFLVELDYDDDDDDIIIVDSQLPSTQPPHIQSVRELTPGIIIVEEDLEESQATSTSSSSSSDSLDRPPVLPSAFSFPKALSPLLQFTNQSHSLNFTSFVTHPPTPFATSTPLNSQWKKVGEASYSEVFASTSIKGEKLVVKIIPVRDPSLKIDLKDKIDYPMASEWESVLREIEITDLVGGEGKRLDGFVQFRGAFIVQGKYPAQLLSSWDEFKSNQLPICDDQIRPDVLPSNQVYAILCLVHGGQDLESYKIRSWKEALSIFRQIVKICSLAEKAIEFEHRDLHIGNVLVQKIDSTSSLNSDIARLSLGRGTRASLAETSANTVLESSDEVEVTFIDFTLSRAKRPEDGRIFFDAFGDESLFDGEGLEDDGDYQFDVYRCMESETDQNWEGFHPRTNILWLHYLLLKLLAAKISSRRISAPTTSSSPRPSVHTTHASRVARSLMLIHPTARKVKTLSSTSTSSALILAKEVKLEKDCRDKMMSMELVLRESLNGLGEDWKRRKGPKSVVGFLRIKTKNSKKEEIKDRSEIEISSAGEFYEAFF